MHSVQPLANRPQLTLQPIGELAADQVAQGPGGEATKQASRQFQSSQ
jgi:hypothetical protein